jgi:adenylate cyclase
VRARRKTILLLLTALLAPGAGVLAYATHVLRRPELSSLDARYSIRSRHRPPGSIVLVNIDGLSLNTTQNVGQRLPYPFPRRYDARVIDRLRSAGARVIALDIVFQRETDPADDNALVEAVGRARGRIVLAATEASRGETNVLGGSKLLGELGARPGIVNLVLDADGIVRRLRYAEHGVASFPVAVAEVARGRPVPRSLFENGTLPIDFDGPPEAMASIPFVRVLQGHFPRDFFKGKIVIVGAQAPILHDYQAVATSGSEVMPGPEIHANAVDTLMRGAPLRNASGWLQVLLIVVMGAVIPLAGLRALRRRTLLFGLLLAAVFTVAVQLAFNAGRIVVFVYPLLALVLGVFGTLAVFYLVETIERERVRDVFSRFVPGGVVEEVLAITGEDLRLGAVERDCTVLFSDLRGFTSFSETQPAARVIEVVNTYLHEMTQAILEAGGTLISYMGDGIMAIFGAPLEQEDHADRAVAAAREMVGPRLERFNSWLAQEGFEHSFAMGVGLNSGLVMAGNVGAEHRIEYTAIGDTTNTASRLEGLTKGSGVMVFISQTTRERMRRDEQLVPMGEVDIRGRVEKLAVWTLAESVPATREREHERSPPAPAGESRG